MPQPQLKTARNASLECCKLIASFFVVFIHVPFPGELGEFITCLARFAVPMFFAISGYFSYQADRSRLSRRILHLFLLNLIATLLYALWGCFKAEVLYWGSAADHLLWTLRGENLVEWLVLHINPFAGHLWYLTALFVCYLILFAYICLLGRKKTDYRPLYILGGCLFAVFLALSEFSDVTNLRVAYQVYRNGWFFGFPMFLMGIFLHEYQEHILLKCHLSTGKLIAISLAGVLCSILEWQLLGGWDVYIGTVIAVSALLLLLVSHPNLKKEFKIITRFGSISTSIYILHLLLLDIYGLFFQQSLSTALGHTEEYLRPVLILCASVAVSFLWECCRSFGKRSTVNHTK